MSPEIPDFREYQGLPSPRIKYNLDRLDNPVFLDCPELREMLATLDNPAALVLPAFRDFPEPRETAVSPDSLDCQELLDSPENEDCQVRHRDAYRNFAL